MSKAYYIFISTLIILITISCQEIDPDPLDPRLPKYTTYGKNISGAYINDAPWESSFLNSPNGRVQNPIVLKSNSTENIIELQFIGNKTGSICFQIRGLDITTEEDLLKLDKQKIPLDGKINSGCFHYYQDETKNVNNGVGQIYFTKVVKDTIFDEEMEIIDFRTTYSGTFGFEGTDESGEALKISSGRFDYSATVFLDNEDF